MKLSSFYYNFVYGVHLRKPLLTLRILKNLFNILIRRKTLLRYVDICKSVECNLACVHCFADNFRVKKKTSLTNEEWVRVFDECRALGTLAFGFTGGEPLLDKNLEDLIRLAKPSQTLILIATNGMPVTKERARSLYEAGVDVMQISIESLVPEEHNEFRKNDTAWRKSMQGIDNALEAGIKVCVVPTVSHLNIHSAGFLELLEWAKRKGVLVNLALATPMGAWNGRRDILLTEEDMRTLDELVARYPHVRRDFETNYFYRGCGAATEKLYFTPSGEVLSCPYMHITFGNVREESVKDIRGKMLTVKKLQGYYPKCLVAEDHEFIEGPLATTFEAEDKVVDWKEAFGLTTGCSSGGGCSGHCQPQ